MVQPTSCTDDGAVWEVAVRIKRPSVRSIVENIGRIDDEEERVDFSTFTPYSCKLRTYRPVLHTPYVHSISTTSQHLNIILTPVDTPLIPGLSTSYFIKTPDIIRFAPVN
jgi:hypothetical protein